MWVYLSPQINGMWDAANYFSNWEQYQLLEKIIVFRGCICACFLFSQCWSDYVKKRLILIMLGVFFNSKQLQWNDILKYFYQDFCL